MTGHGAAHLRCLLLGVSLFAGVTGLVAGASRGFVRSRPNPHGLSRRFPGERCRPKGTSPREGRDDGSGILQPDPVGTGRMEESENSFWRVSISNRRILTVTVVRTFSSRAGPEQIVFCCRPLEISSDVGMPTSAAPSIWPTRFSSCFTFPKVLPWTVLTLWTPVMTVSWGFRMPSRYCAISSWQKGFPLLPGLGIVVRTPPMTPFSAGAMTLAEFGAYKVSRVLLLGEN